MTKVASLIIDCYDFDVVVKSVLEFLPRGLEYFCDESTSN